MAGIKKLMEKFIKFGDGETDAILVDNDEWLGKLGYIDFLRDIGSHFSVNRMLAFDSVKMRLEREQNLSFLEFNYMLLQAYDFVELYNRYGCRLQIGGSDQWGNIVNGIDLQKRLHPAQGQQRDVYGLTTPLITTASGAKMGKTAQGAVWLTEDLLSPYDYWQFWRNTEDKDVGRFLRLFTELPISEIEKLEMLQGADINSAKIVLANEATKICHGEKAALEAEQTAQKTFEQGGIGDSLPVFEIAKSELAAGMPVFKILIQAGLADSGGAAKRLIQGGGGKINDNKIEDEMLNVDLTYVNNDGVIKLSSGKKKHALIKVV
jgi:tyrosyl-tRNA synthetase